jgi:hypothetical protein
MRRSTPRSARWRRSQPPLQRASKQARVERSVRGHPQASRPAPLTPRWAAGAFSWLITELCRAHPRAFRSHPGPDQIRRERGLGGSSLSPTSSAGDRKPCPTSKPLGDHVESALPGGRQHQLQVTVFPKGRAELVGKILQGVFRHFFETTSPAGALQCPRPVCRAPSRRGARRRGQWWSHLRAAVRT